MFTIFKLCQRKKEGAPPKLRNVVAICLNGLPWESNRYDAESLKNDFDSELGLVLTESNQRSLYPNSREGRQAFSTNTAPKG